MIYKCWSDLPPHDGKVRIAAAFADHPAGPWERMDVPIFDVPGEMFAAEDPYVYSQGGKIYCLLKDMGNFYIHDIFRSMIRFVSDDGIDWKPAEPMFLRSRVMDFEGEGKKSLTAWSARSFTSRTISRGCSSPRYFRREPRRSAATST